MLQVLTAWSRAVDSPPLQRWVERLMDRLGVYFDQRLVCNVLVDDAGRFTIEYDET